MKSLLTPSLATIVLALAAATPALAFNPQPDPPGRWAMLGLVAEQTARLSVLAVPSARDARIGSCTVTLNFLDGDGNKLAEAATLVLLPGKAQFVDLKGSGLRLVNRSDRAQFRSNVEVLHNPPGFQPCAGVAATVEVFDASGRSSVTVAQPVQY
ncbi:MAG: hypothetical protein H7337_20305 [Rhizobacter sp.]|nr:hypothetical protein [Rhizobacter sp.]